MNATKKVIFEFWLIPLTILNFLFSILCFGTDLILKKIKAKAEAAGNKPGLNYKILTVVFNTLLVGIPYLSNLFGKLIRKASDKITEYITKIKE